MNIHWSNLDVRVYAAEAWVSLAPRFAEENSGIIDQIEAILSDPVPAVRLQAAQNLQVICVAAPDRMWAMAERLVTYETDIQIVASYLSRSMWRFCHSDPERCEALLSIVKDRLDGGLGSGHEGRDLIQEAFGSLTAQLYAAQGRELMRTWLVEWAAAPQSYSTLLDSFASSLRSAFFHRYKPAAEEEACAMCDRAQEGLAFIITQATRVSAEAYDEHASDITEAEKQLAVEKYRAAEKVIRHAMNQLYFGSGAHAENNENRPGLPDADEMSRFLSDYTDILALLASSREPGTLHYLIDLYEFLIPGDPVAVFEAIHAILLGRGEEEGYHYESLGNSSVVRIVQRYIADHRAIFEDEGRRGRLVAILQLFSRIGWTDSLRLLYDLPDLLR